MFQGSKATYLVTTRNRELQQGQAATRLTLSAEVVSSARNQADLRYFKAVAWKADPTMPEEDKMVGPRLICRNVLLFACSALKSYLKKNKGGAEEALPSSVICFDKNLLQQPGITSYMGMASRPAVKMPFCLNYNTRLLSLNSGVPLSGGCKAAAVQVQWVHAGSGRRRSRSQGQKGAGMGQDGPRL